MGPSEKTCEHCISNLFPLADDEVCSDCGLNPMLQGDAAAEKFIVEAAERTAGLSIDELNERHAMDSLRRPTAPLRRETE